MRTAVFMGAVVVAKAINAETIKDGGMALFLVFLFCLFSDIVREARS